MNRTFLGISAIVIVLGLAGAAGMVSHASGAKDRAFSKFLVSLEVRHKMTPDLDVTSARSDDAVPVLEEIGLEAVRAALADPDDARVRGTIVTFNPKRREVHVCGFLDTRDRSGRFMVPDAFFTKLKLSDTIETSSATRPVFYSFLVETGQSYVAATSGSAGKAFYPACGNGFIMEMIKDFSRI